MIWHERWWQARRFGFEIWESEARARDAVKHVGGAIEIVL
jgi:hypothetical protein